jgi:hypothetical protein
MGENKKSSWFARHKILTGVLTFFVVMIIVNAATGGSKNDSATNDSDQSMTTPTADPTDDAVVTEDPEPTEEPTEEAPSVPTEYLSAVEKAQSYSDNMYMSKVGIYDQLVSEYGEQFTPEAAQYGIDHVDADWNYNALQKAKSYQETMSMSPAAIHDQLTSEYGEKFTESQADYAISHLN